MTETTDHFETIADGVVLQRNVMVPARDGIRLATDIYRPARNGVALTGAFPVILERTPYDKAGTPRTEFSRHDPTPMTRAGLAIYFVRRGYVVIWQDCRGRFASEGHFTKYLSEGEDGYDAMEWIAAQSWCNGRIGTMGLSYAAHTQMAMACLNPPGLACMVVDSGGFSNAYSCGIRQGGAFELKQATWAYNRASEGVAPEIAAAVKAESLHDWFTRMPWSRNRSPIRWNGEYEDYLLEQWQHGTFDDFWKKVGLYAEGYRETFPKIPIAFMSSWLDVYVPSTLDNYTGLKAQGASSLALVMGPWTHGNRSQTVFGDVDFGPRATFDENVAPSWLAYRTSWFDRWLKDSAGGNEEDNARPVQVFIMGGGTGGKTEEGHLDHGGHWIEADEWPLPETSERVLYLNADMSLAPAAGAQSAITYDFDPSDPVPTIGGALTSGEPIFSGGGFDQVEASDFYGCKKPGLPLSARLDVLSFETETLTEDLTVAGPIEVSLWVSSDAADTDFTAKLIDVYPPSRDYPRGYALNITDGIFRCRYRNGFENPQPIAKEEMFRVSITPFATANLFRKGHRLRLDISSSNFPKFDVNPNVFAPEGTSRSRRVARNTVFLGTPPVAEQHGEQRPSLLKLTVIGGKAKPSATA
ncbi:UNVERIFIED_ORG: hypothetical protein BCL66_12425 [Martelella mediterranea]